MEDRERAIGKVTILVRDLARRVARLGVAAKIATEHLGAFSRIADEVKKAVRRARRRNPTAPLKPVGEIQGAMLEQWPAKDRAKVKRAYKKRRPRARWMVSPEIRAFRQEQARRAYLYRKG